MLKHALILLTFAMSFSSCGKPNGATEEENHDILPCGISDPLQNIEWLKEFCESLYERPDIVRVRIDLYKVIDTDEHLFKIGISHSEVAACLYSEDWINCTGELIFSFQSCAPISIPK